MLTGMECLLSVRNPSSSSHISLPLCRAPRLQSPFVEFCSPRSVHSCHKVAAKISSSSFQYSRLHDKSNGWLVAFAVSHEESHPEKEKDVVEPKESEKAWKQALESFNEQASKMRNVSQEAYEVYSERAALIIQKASDQLKVQADQTRNDFSVLANEISLESKEYLSLAAEKSPEAVKNIVETYSSSTDDVKELSHLRDFHLGIPYGFLLSLGGFISFMLTGSIAAIRFGIILGGVLLALSIWSLKSYQKGNSSAIASAGQTAIAAVIFLREIRLLFQGAPFFTYFTTAVSGAAVVFFLYKLKSDNRQSGTPAVEPKSQN